METRKITDDHGEIERRNLHEMAVLGAILIDPRLLPIALASLAPEYFFNPAHQRIFTAFLECHAEEVPIDFITAHERAAVPFFDIARLAEYAGLNAFDYHIKRVRGYAIKRKAQYRLEDAMNTLGQWDVDLIAEFKNMSEDVLEWASDGRIETLGDGIVQMLKEIEGEKRFVPTGILPLDQLCAGYFPGQLWVIAGRTSMGKSGLAQNLALNLIERGQVASYVPLEGDNSEVRRRLLAIKSGVPLFQLAGGNFDLLTATEISAAAKKLDSLPLYLPEREFEWKRLSAQVELLKFRDPNLKVVFIDYLGMIRNSGYRSRWEEIGSVTRGAKHLAQKLKIAVVLLCQINRDTEKRRDHKPILADLRDSGSVEQDADVILLIYRENYYKPSADPVASIAVAKQRNGPTGSFELNFNPATLKFSE